MFGFHRHGGSLGGFVSILTVFYLITAGVGQEAGIPLSILEDLSAEKFADREAAQQRLLGWATKSPKKASAVLLQQARESEDPEVRSRCMQALKELILELEYRADGFLGVRMQEVKVDLPGGAGVVMAIRVVMLVENSPASEAGLIEGALIVGLNDKTWKEGPMAMDFSERIRQMRPGTKVTLQLLENGVILRKEVEIGERPVQGRDIDDAGPAEANERAREEFFQKWLDKQPRLPR